MGEATGDTNTEADAPESDPALTDFLDDWKDLRGLREEYHKPLVAALCENDCDGRPSRGAVRLDHRRRDEARDMAREAGLDVKMLLGYKRRATSLVACSTPRTSTRPTAAYPVYRRHPRQSVVRDPGRGQGDRRQ